MKFCALLLLLLALINPLQAREPRARKKAGPPAPPAPLLSCDLNGADLSFLETTAASQNAQLSLATAVTARAQEAEVRVIAKSLVDEGKLERAALVKLAAQKGLPLPAQPGATQAAQPLQKLNGPKFDKQAMLLISKLEHDRAATFAAGTSSQDAEIRAFAEAHYPAVQESLLLIAKLTGTSQPTIESPARALPSPVAEKLPTE